MPRKKYVLDINFPVHISARCINKEWFSLPIDSVWRIMEDYLFLLHHGFGFQIHSFVLMSNHFHMIIRTPQDNLSRGMNYFMRETSRQIGRESNRINQVYGSRYHKTSISNPLYYLHAYKYVYRNPVEAGLASDVCAYPYSTLSGLVGVTNLFIPVCRDDTLFGDFAGTLAWLNSAPTKENRDAIRRGLRKINFTLAKSSNKGHSALEHSKY